MEEGRRFGPGVAGFCKSLDVLELAELHSTKNQPFRGVSYHKKEVDNDLAGGHAKLQL